MADGYIGLGYQPRCPNCGSANVVETEHEDAKALLCMTCGSDHARNSSGRLVEIEDRSEDR